MELSNPCMGQAEPSFAPGLASVYAPVPLAVFMLLALLGGKGAAQVTVLSTQSGGGSSARGARRRSGKT
jgi:hypothetical protein